MTPNPAPRAVPEAPTAPPHLSADAQKWWRSTAAEYVLEDHHLRLLTEAAVAWDRCQQARAVIDAEGITVPGRFGPRSHPAVGIERDARLAFARLMRELDLDGEPLPAPRVRRGGRR
jgi:phage terminase small subunit